MRRRQVRRQMVVVLLLLMRALRDLYADKLEVDQVAVTSMFTHGVVT